MNSNGPGSGSDPASAPPKPPSRRGSHRRRNSEDEMDVVNVLEQDASFSVITRNSDLEGSYSSDDDLMAVSCRNGTSINFGGDPSNDDDIISSDDDLAQSAGTQTSEYTSASRQVADLRDNTKPVTDEIELRLRLAAFFCDLFGVKFFSVV